MLDLTLFRSRSFSVANLATVLYAMGFFAMLLGNILFLTSVWHYSILRAGLAVTPGPLVVAVVAGPAGKLAGRYGFRRVLLTGFVVFTAGWSGTPPTSGFTPITSEVWLPGTLVVGLGIGLTFPGTERRSRVEPPPRAIRSGERGEPDGPPGGWGARAWRCSS